MGRRRSRLHKVEEGVAALYDELVLPDGAAVAVGPLDRFNALCALLDEQGEEHWLATLLLEQDEAKAREIPGSLDSEDFLRVVYGMVMPAKKRREEHEQRS